MNSKWQDAAPETEILFHVFFNIPLWLACSCVLSHFDILMWTEVFAETS